MFDPSEVKNVAAVEGYIEVEVAGGDRGRLLSFRHFAKRGCGETNNELGPVSICVFITTGSVSTSLGHPKSGKGQLFRNVDSLTMLKKIFNNPRLHSDVGYKKTVAEHKQSSVSGHAITSIALGNNCKQLTVKPQERGSLLIFQHPVGRIRVWFKKGTMEIQMGKQMFWKKNLNLDQIREYFESPWKVLHDVETQSCDGPSFTYSPLQTQIKEEIITEYIEEVRTEIKVEDKTGIKEEVKTEIKEEVGSTSCLKRETSSKIFQPLQSKENCMYEHSSRIKKNCMNEYKSRMKSDSPSSSVLSLGAKEDKVIDNRKPLKCATRERLEALANQKGYSKFKDTPILLAFKDSEGVTTINVYTTKGTVTVQPGHGSTKNCSVADFQKVLYQHSMTRTAQYQPLFPSSYLAHDNEQIKDASPPSSRSEKLSEAMEKARASAAALFSVRN